MKPDDVVGEIIGHGDGRILFKELLPEIQLKLTKAEETEKKLENYLVEEVLWAEKCDSLESKLTVAREALREIARFNQRGIYTQSCKDCGDMEGEALSDVAIEALSSLGQDGGK